MQFKTISIEEIKILLPHKYPMLLIDKVLTYEVDKNIIAVKNITFNEPFFQGHFPTKSLMPGVLMMEAMAQTAGVLIKKTITDPEKCKLVFFTTIESAKFRKPVVPGDTLIISVEKQKSKMGVWKFMGRCVVDNNIVTEGIFSLAVVND